MNNLDDYRRELTKLDELIGGTELAKIDNAPAAKQLVKVKKMIQDDNVSLKNNNPIKIDKKTNRGFPYGEFTDSHGDLCTIQQSSACSIDDEEGEYIWLGIDKVVPKIMASKAKSLGIETNETTGWIPYPIPDEVLLNSRMHLSQKKVEELLPILNYFVENGRLKPS